MPLRPAISGNMEQEKVHIDQHVGQRSIQLLALSFSARVIIQSNAQAPRNSSKSRRFAVHGFL